MNSVLNPDISDSMQKDRLYKEVCKFIVKPHTRLGYGPESGVGYYAMHNSMFVYAGPTMCSIDIKVSHTPWKYEGMKYHEWDR